MAARRLGGNVLFFSRHCGTAVETGALLSSIIKIAPTPTDPMGHDQKKRCVDFTHKKLHIVR